MRALHSKKILLLFLILPFIISCLKEDDGWAKEMELLRQYLGMNDITVQPTASGLYYVETIEGTGPAVELNDYLIIKYTAQLINGLIYDTTDSLTAAQNGIYREGYLYGSLKFKLSSISIQGVYEGLTYMKEGGSARLIIPSKIGFGPVTYGPIPAYSTLIYDIELIEVIKDPVAHEAALLENYLIDNDITIDPTATGLYYIEELEGEGNFPVQGNTCVVKYTGKLIDGRIFAKVVGTNTYPFTIGITEIIAGFQEGVYLMKPGGKATFIIPSDIAYGPGGSLNGVIPPYSTLIYEIELISIN